MMLKRCTKALCFWGLACIFAGSSGATVERVTVDQLTGRAQMILIGTVESAYSYWNGDETLIYTDYSIVVEDVMKGNLSSPSITVTIEGGTVGEIGLHVSEQPSFRPSERVLIYLGGCPDGTTRVVYDLQGKLTIVGDVILETGDRLEDYQSRIEEAIHAQTN